MTVHPDPLARRFDSGEFWATVGALGLVGWAAWGCLPALVVGTASLTGAYVVARTLLKRHRPDRITSSLRSSEFAAVAAHSALALGLRPLGLAPAWAVAGLVGPVVVFVVCRGLLKQGRPQVVTIVRKPVSPV